MKKGISVWPDLDRAGKWMLHIQKAKGRLTLDEVREAVKEYEEGLYFLYIDAMNEDDTDAEQDGDHAILYCVDRFTTEEDC